MITVFSRKSILLLSSVLLIVCSMWTFGHRQLGGFDMSALTDTGWRIANYQNPYHDFPLTTPVAFYVGAGWAFQLFGIHWSSFVVMAIGFTVLSFLGQFYLLSMVISWKPSLCIALVFHLLSSVVISYWWYNSITVNAAGLFIAAAYLFANKPEEQISTIALWFTLTLLSLMKPNIAGGLAILVFAVLLVFSAYKIKLLLIGSAAVFSFFTILFFLKISPVDVIQSYIAIGKVRATPTLRWFYNDKPHEHLVVIPLILFSLLPLLEKVSRFTFKHNTSKVRLNLAVTIVSFLMGGLSLLTNSDSNLIVGIPFFLLGSSVFYFITEHMNLNLPAPRRFWWYLALGCIAFEVAGSFVIQATSRLMDKPLNLFSSWFVFCVLTSVSAVCILVLRLNSSNEYFLSIWMRARMIWALLLVCGGVAMYAGAMRWRVLYIGYESFFTYSSLTEIKDLPFFQDFYVSQTAKETMSEIKQVLINRYKVEEKWKNAPIYFGTRIEFAYATFGILSPRNLPIWWHSNNSYSLENEPEYVQSFLNHNFEYAFFMKTQYEDKPDFGFLPDAIVNNLLANYDRISYDKIVVFQKK
ncbi:MAG: hypothetical protein U0Z26_09790 [Anaerolineales bacterium]